MQNIERRKNNSSSFFDEQSNMLLVLKGETIRNGSKNDDMRSFGVNKNKLC